MTEQSQHRRPIIGYITPQIYSSYFRLLLAGVQRAARERGAGLMVFQMSAQEVAESQVGRDRVSGWVACFSDRHTAGLEDLARSGRPLVTTSVPIAGAPVVVTDNTSGMRSVVEHLLDLGHRRVGFVGWVGNPDIPYRLAGYRQALEARGIPFDPALVTTLTGGWQHDGAAFAEQLVAAGRSCTALAFANDNLALGAMRVFQSAGVRIPQELAITGFDDMPEAQIATPPLTTVRMRFSAMSRAATEHLLDIVAGAPPAAEPIMIPMSLVVRRSAGEPSHRPTEVPADIAKRGLLARRLAEMVGAPEVLAPGEPPSRLWPGVDTVVEMVDAALRADAGPDDSAIQQAWSSAVAASSYADPLEGAVGQIEAVLRAELASQPPESPAHQSVADAIQRLRVMLLRACVGGQIERINRSEQALSFSDSAARSLADSDLATACGLGWLEHSGVSAAALGLWDAQGQPRHLRIAGHYPAAAAAAANLVAAPLFPPTELVGAAPKTPVSILPLRSARREWGFIAIALPEDLETSAFDSAPLLAALLTARIDSATLQQEREEQQNSLQTAYERERALAETVRELGCPILPLSESTLLVPLIGMIGTLRAEQIISTLLRAAETYRAAAVLLDVTGVSLIDTHVAGLLVRLSQMLRLLGANVALVGMRPEIAQSIVALGVDLSGLNSYASLMAAMAAMRR